MAKKKRRQKKARRHTPRYVRRIEMMHRAGLFPAGGATCVEVRHDDSCGHWRGGACGCNFDLVLRPLPAAPNKE